MTIIIKKLPPVYDLRIMIEKLDEMDQATIIRLLEAYPQQPELDRVIEEQLRNPSDLEEWDIPE